VQYERESYESARFDKQRKILRICIVLSSFHSSLRFLRQAYMHSSITVDAINTYTCTSYCDTTILSF